MSTETSERKDTKDIDLTSIVIPIESTVQDEESNFNASPPALPELFQEDGRTQIPYVLQVGLGRNGIEKHGYYVKDEHGNETDEVNAFFTADFLFKVVQPAEDPGFELDVREFQQYLQLKDRATSFIPKGKKKSAFFHVAQFAGLTKDQFTTLDALAEEFDRRLRDKANPIQCLGFNQWQWYSKLIQWSDRSGKAKTGKVVLYGMNNAQNKNDDGSADPVIIYKPTGETLTASAKLTRVMPLN